MLFAEKEAEQVAAKIRGASRVITSRLTQVEAQRALIRLSTQQLDSHKVIPLMERELKVLWPKIDFIEITRNICDVAGRVSPKSQLRSLDAIHLATFLHLKALDPSIEILTYDERIKSEVVS
jgi:predicted nucleic acid-binding protein